jgi:hypothetical protein
MRKIALIILISFLTNCQNKPPVRQKNKFDPQQISNDSALYHFPDIARETNRDNLLSEIQASECVESKFINISGDYSRTFACFERLNEISSDSSLFELTKSKFSVVRAYAFQALRTRNKVLSNLARKYLQNDTAKICIIISDTKDLTDIKSYILGL